MPGKALLLLVDDDNDALELLQFFLQEAGFEVIVAEDGERAIKFLNQFHPQAIVTDLMMPRVSGIELIDHIRNSPELQHIPIVVLTASRKELINEAYIAGADKVFEKPANYGEVQQTISSFFKA